jgi:hypothetical protein
MYSFPMGFLRHAEWLASTVGRPREDWWRKWWWLLVEWEMVLLE